MHRAPGAVKACGWRRPTQSPKQLCCTLERNQYHSGEASLIYVCTRSAVVT